MIQAKRIQFGDRSAILQAFEQAIREFHSGGSLAAAALGIALIEYPNLDRQHYLNWLSGQADLVRPRLPARATAEEIVTAINERLYDELGFHGNSLNYYDPRNSFLNDVIERRLAIPITLSVIYLEIGRQLGLDLQGVGLPGHFIVRCQAQRETGPALFYIDPFNRGAMLDEAGCAELVEHLYDGRLPFQRGFLRVAPEAEILRRMINNLKGIYSQAKLLSRLLTLQEMLLVLHPTDPDALRDRALLNLQLEDYASATRDLQVYFAQVPSALNDQNLQNILKTCQEKQAQLN